MKIESLFFTFTLLSCANILQGAASARAEHQGEQYFNLARQSAAARAHNNNEQNQKAEAQANQNAAQTMPVNLEDPRLPQSWQPLHFHVAMDATDSAAQETFEDLRKAKHDNKKSYFIAVSKEREGQSLTAFDAHSFNRCLATDTGANVQRLPGVVRQTPINAREIFYFILDPQSNQFVFYCSLEQLLKSNAESKALLTEFTTNADGTDENDQMGEKQNYKNFACVTEMPDGTVSFKRAEAKKDYWNDQLDELNEAENALAQAGIPRSEPAPEVSKLRRISSLAGLVLLGLAHGLTNSWMSHEKGMGTKNVSFINAPFREWITALIFGFGLGNPCQAAGLRLKEVVIFKVPCTKKELLMAAIGNVLYTGAQTYGEMFLFPRSPGKRDFALNASWLWFLRSAYAFATKQ